MAISVTANNEAVITHDYSNFTLMRMDSMSHSLPVRGRLHKVIGECWCKPESRVMNRGRVWQFHNLEGK